MQKVAIFDIDGTIFRSSLLIELTEAMVSEGIFPKKVLDAYQKQRNEWLNRKGSYHNYVMAVVKTFEKNIVGVDYLDFTRVAKKVINSQRDRVYQYTRDLVAKLKKKNYYLLAISHSPKEILDEFCSNLGFDKVYGRIYEYDARKKFTGKTLYVDLISNKSNILRRFVEKENLSLSGSFGVGDSESDISFLTFVENPICFNPNKKLYNHAKKAKWKIVVERKDVIYFL